MNQLSVIKKILVGPTASGKSDVAHAIASRSGSGIISADAMMIYSGMDIGTAKPNAGERRRFVYAGLDLTTPDNQFSVHDYLHAIEQQLRQPGRPSDWIVAGGTGLYVRCLIMGLDSAVGANAALRREADGILANDGFEALKRWCTGKVPSIANDLPEGDALNPRRWIRAVERGAGPLEAPRLRDDIRIAGLRWSREALEKRIVARVERMYAAGLIEEVNMLKKQYQHFSPTAEKAIGYQEALAVLNGCMKVDEAKQRTVIRTRQYAKRQMTWFRHQLPTKWVDVSEGKDVEEIAQCIEHVWNHHE